MALCLQMKDFQNHLISARRGCLEHFSSTFLAGHPSPHPSSLVRSWPAGWNLCLGGISDSHAHFAFNAHDWEPLQISERASSLWVGVGATSPRTSACPYKTLREVWGEAPGGSLLLCTTLRAFQLLHCQHAVIALAKVQL